ncbi:MAG: response regulator [Gammaproteobacteria bacterium]|uniref:response regulator transcription factor n=1 Tax=Rhodoferax sp. TaxID=50421 RepID=UPI0017EA3989|nr:response regulator [Rhodoferax sp.]MBU3899831.1 response regulator [Gammaproteobacteria bacterium]MBA3057943.1 response regulator [Rhodoferax sp.]MBU3996014.1 response regulator [Gammaproteobacteria bacterium]MBU4019096.1 response regulator [Gammaproteobacteria bacterium]MBU4078814.1 response regulator [Gammaproteobacteria bacterium]
MDHPTPKSVLIVDDSRVSRMLIKSLILARFPDWTLTEAVSGDEALALAATQTFDYCSMDINMPGLSGTEATEQLLKMQPTVRVSLFSANIQESQQVRAAQLGVRFVAKPVTQKSVALALAYFQGRD